MNQSTEANAKIAREAWIRALERTASIDAAGVTLPTVISRLAGRFEGAPALVSAEATLSYRELAIRCNQYTRWGLAQGLGTGDTVWLLMDPVVFTRLTGPRGWPPARFRVWFAASVLRLLA